MNALQRDLVGVFPASVTSRPRGRSVTEDLHVAQLAAGVVVALAYLAATAASADSAITAFAAAAAVIAVVSPLAGLATLALILPMREPDAFQPLYVNAVVLGGTALGCLLRLPGDHRPVRIHPGIVLAIGYLIYTVLSVVPAVSGHPAEWAPTAALQALKIATSVGVFIVAGIVFRWTSPMPILAIALAGAVGAAMLALLAYWKVGPVGALEGLLAPMRGERASGGFSNANYLGFFLAQATLLGLGIWSVVRLRYRPLLVIALVALVSGLVVSFSRSAYLATLAGILVLTFIRSPRVAALLAVCMIAAAVVLYPTVLEARLGGSDVLDPSAIGARAQSENWRRLAAAAGVSMFLSEPVFGVGFGIFHHMSPAYIGASPATYSHNAYIQVLAEQGLVGVLMVGALVIVTLVAIVKSTSPLRAAAIAMLIAYLLQSFFINSTTSTQITGLTVLTIAAALSPAHRWSAARPKEV